MNETEVDDDTIKDSDYIIGEITIVEEVDGDMMESN